MGNFPINDHPQWFKRDSTKLKTYEDCGRLYFFEHLLGWKPDVPAHDLWFGSAYHKAREHQLLYGYEDVEGAMVAFLNDYRLHFDQSTDEMYSPKNPTAVLHALLKFRDEHKDDLREFKLVEREGVKLTEISGTVPVDEKRVLYYKMDSVLENIQTSKVRSWDHKTTSGKWIHDTRWDNELYLSIQCGTYTHALYCMYPIDQVDGVEFYKIGFEFLSKGSKNRPAGYDCTIRKIPAFKRPDQMNSWLWTVNDLLDDIDRDLDRLSHCTDNDSTLMAFRMNPTSCQNYRGCPFHDFCMEWRNPLQRCQIPPLGFVQEFWDPSTIETTNKINLEWPK
jgi:hypothetical protein